MSAERAGLSETPSIALPDLPNEILLNIVSKLNSATLLSCRLVCHRWNEVVFDAIPPSRLTLAVGKAEERRRDFSPALIEADARLWRNLSYDRPSGLRDFFQEIRSPEYRQKWETVRSLDILVETEQDLINLYEAVNSHFLRNLEALYVHFTEEARLRYRSSILGRELVIHPSTLPNLTALYLYHKSPGKLVSATPTGLVQGLVDAAANLTSLTCHMGTNGFVLTQLPKKLCRLETSRILPSYLQNMKETPQSLSLAIPASDLNCNGKFPILSALKELELLDIEPETGISTMLLVDREIMKSFPNLEKITSGCSDRALTVTATIFAQIRAFGYEGLQTVKLTVPDPTEEEEWHVLQGEVIPLLPQLKKLHLIIRSNHLFFEASDYQLTSLLNIQMPHLVLECMKSISPWKREEPAAFPFREFFGCLSFLNWELTDKRGGILEIKGGGCDAEEFGLIDPARFTSAVRKLQKGWDLVRMKNFMIELAKVEALEAEIRWHALPVELFYGIKSD